MAGEVKELSVFPMGEENPFGQYFTGRAIGRRSRVNK